MTSPSAPQPSPGPVRPAPAISVTGLRKTYGSHAAVDGLDLHVETGEIFALLGPNGAGKTTTVEILEGFRVPDSGTVRVLGEDPASADRAWRSRIGVVMQDSRDTPELSVAELVHHVATYYPSPRDPDEVIDVVGLRAKAGTRARQLSGGQRRRLDVALGIVGNPELLFLDEPTTGFDPQARRSFWELVLSLREGGTTILLTTHYLDEAAHLADRAAVVQDGRVVALGAPDELGGVQARLPVVHWESGGQAHAERTSHPTALVARLAAEVPLVDGEVPGLRVERPSLEDVYLSLIGDTAARAAHAGDDPGDHAVTTTSTTSTAARTAASAPIARLETKP